MLMITTIYIADYNNINIRVYQRYQYCLLSNKIIKQGPVNICKFTMILNIVYYGWYHVSTNPENLQIMQLMISLVQRLNSIHKVFIFWFEFEDSTQITMMNLIREKNTPAYCDKKKKTLLSSPIHFTVLWCWCHDTCKCRQQTTTRYDRKNQLFVTLSNIKKKTETKNGAVCHIFTI